MRAFAVLLLLTLPLLSAPVPAEEKPKPRAKLVATLSVPVRVEATQWMPDGKHLVLVTDQRVLVYPREQFRADKPKPLTAFDRPQQMNQVELTPDGGLCVFTWAGTKVNAESRLSVWSAKSLLGGGEPKADRVLDLSTSYIQAPRLATDGGVVGVVVERNADGDPNGGYKPTLLRVSGKTGDVVAKTPLSELADGQYTGSLFDPHSGRIYVATRLNGEDSLTCRELGAAKPLWERKLPGKASRYYDNHFLLSADGRRLAYVQPTESVVPPKPPQGGLRPGGVPPRAESVPTRSLLVLDTKTGERGPELTTEDIRDARAHAFSADGRLLFAEIATADETKLGVWDVTTGAEVKVWSRDQRSPGSGRTISGDIGGAFHPTAAELVIVEREFREVPAPFVGTDGRRGVERVDYTTVVGLWDLSAVVK